MTDQDFRRGFHMLEAFFVSVGATDDDRIRFAAAVAVTNMQDAGSWYFALQCECLEPPERITLTREYVSLEARRAVVHRER
jgi:hypothetical protein